MKCLVQLVMEHAVRGANRTQLIAPVVHREYSVYVGRKGRVRSFASPAVSLFFPGPVRVSVQSSLSHCLSRRPALAEGSSSFHSQLFSLKKRTVHSVKCSADDSVSREREKKRNCLSDPLKSGSQEIKAKYVPDMCVRGRGR